MANFSQAWFCSTAVQANKLLFGSHSSLSLSHLAEVYGKVTNFNHAKCVIEKVAPCAGETRVGAFGPGLVRGN